MPRNGRLVVDHADRDSLPTQAPDDAEALVVTSEHDSARLRGVVTDA
jgi:hypothetical protein